MPARASRSPAQPWWRTAAGYEVYLRSFADGDGDGVGDLRGLRSHLDHLAWLGVDFVWITPFYPSPLADHGYDITDHTAVDPRYGTLDDLDAVIADAHRLGMRVLVDLVPNHTSDQHPWFTSSRQGRDDPKRSWYHWRDGSPDGGPPNNWVSYFGGSGWTYDPASDQWWSHLFLPEQPDLNWAQPGVREAFDDILRFWVDRGVDGFRVDVAQGIGKHPDYPDNPPHPDPPAGDGPRADFAAQEHRYDIGQPESLEVFRHWNELVASHDVVLLGEVYLDDLSAVSAYLAGDGLHLSFTFAFADITWDAAAVWAALRDTHRHLGSAACWTQTSHDEPRPPSRFGGGDRGRARSLAVTTLLAGMPGPFVLYQGEELGLEDAVVGPDMAQDPLGDRDGCRSPIPWSPTPGWGFTEGPSAWMPFGDRRPEDTVADQVAEPRSPIHRYRQLLAGRRRLDPTAEVEWMDGDEGIGAYRRGDVVVAAAISDRGQVLHPGPGRWWLWYSTDPDRLLEEVVPPCRLGAAEGVLLGPAPWGSPR